MAGPGSLSSSNANGDLGRKEVLPGLGMSQEERRKEFLSVGSNVHRGRSGRE